MRRYTICVEGRSYEIDVEERSPDTFSVQVDGRAFEVRLEGQSDPSRALVGPGLEIADAPRRPEPADAPLGAADDTQRSPSAPGADTLTAPMPGTILRVDVAPGAVVRRGEPLVVLEAMKMKNTLKAQRDAVVAQVLVADGTQVNHGDPIIRFEV